MNANKTREHKRREQRAIAMNIEDEIVGRYMRTMVPDTFPRLLERARTLSAFRRREIQQSLINGERRSR